VHEKTGRQNAIHSQGLWSNWLAIQAKAGLWLARAFRPNPLDTRMNMMNPR
jgi:hypothetical protein